MRTILGPELGPRLKPIWGLDPEGEIQGAWRDIGIPRAWCMMGERIFLLFSFRLSIPNVPVGNFALCRFHSTHVALRECLVARTCDVFAGPLISYRFPEIKAIEEGIFDEKRYGLETTSE
jgi:hypothetical protein